MEDANKGLIIKTVNREKSKKSSKESPSTTIILGFTEGKDQFAFKFNE